MFCSLPHCLCPVVHIEKNSKPCRRDHTFFYAAFISLHVLMNLEKQREDADNLCSPLKESLRKCDIQEAYPPALTNIQDSTLVTVVFAQLTERQQTVQASAARSQAYTPFVVSFLLYAENMLASGRTILGKAILHYLQALRHIILAKS